VDVVDSAAAVSEDVSGTWERIGVWRWIVLL
jgi:hypothetical protein